MSRRAFQPTAEQRSNVEVLVGYGMPETEICRLVRNPETGQPIDPKTLRKHFKAEIAIGASTDLINETCQLGGACDGDFLKFAPHP